MANLDPGNKRDYRDHLEGAKLMTRDVLIWMAGEKGDIASRDVANEFNIGIAAAACRLNRLLSWKCIRIIEKGTGNKPHLYVVTDWGYKMADRWKKGDDHTNEE